MNTNQTTLLRLPDVIERTGLCRAAIYALAAEGAFPSPIKISSRSSAWVDSEIEQWARDRINASRLAKEE